MFPKYRIEGHFLLGSSSFTYAKKDLWEEAHYQKGQLIKFINKMGYIGGNPTKKVDEKLLKHPFDIMLLVKTRSWEERKIIFGNLQNFEFYKIFTLNASDVYSLLILV